jgi:hypothetical protein
MTTALPELITLDEAFNRVEADPNTLAIEELQARYFESVKECEEEYGPDVPSIYLHLLPRRGRPKANEAVAPVQTKSVKMPPAFWNQFQTLSRSKGMTIHAAIRSALLEWVERNHAGT